MFNQEKHTHDSLHYESHQNTHDRYIFGLGDERISSRLQ